MKPSRLIREAASQYNFDNDQLLEILLDWFDERALGSYTGDICLAIMTKGLKQDKDWREANRKFIANGGKEQG